MHKQPQYPTINATYKHLVHDITFTCQQLVTMSVVSYVLYANPNYSVTLRSHLSSHNVWRFSRTLQ